MLTIPDDWFPTWTERNYRGERIAAAPSGLAFFLQDSVDQPCPCGGTRRFIGYLYGCVEGRCGFWWQAWRCPTCGAEDTDGY